MVNSKVASKKKRKQRYVPTSDYLLSFDIETTSWDEINATMYDWTLGGADYQELINCKNNDDLKNIVTCCFGRTWADFDICLEAINEAAEARNARFIILIYNFAFEWSFMQKNINFVKDYYIQDYPTVIEGKHSIMSLLAGNLIFLDATRLFGLGSLKQNAEKYGFEKLNYDYEVKRHSKTPLTIEEIEYNENDVLITLGAWAHCLHNNGYENIEGAPYTNTSMIKDVLKRNEHVNQIIGIREHLRYGKNKNRKYVQKEKRKLFDEVQEIAKNVFPKDVELNDIAQTLEDAFMGGYTHCNVYAQGNLYFNVASMDLGSAYPAAMMASWYPRKLIKVVNPKQRLDRLMTTLNRIYTTPIDLIKSTRKQLEAFAVVKIKLQDVCVIKQKEDFTLPLISRHKLYNVSNDAQFDNGKLVECIECELACTTIDLLTWKFCYNYKIVDCTEMYIGSEIQKLPQYWINAVDYCYQAKTILKDVVKLYKSNGDWAARYKQLLGIDEVEIKHVMNMEEHEAIYYLNMVLLQRKGELNGLYGIMVMHIIRNTYQYNEEKDIVKGDNTIRKATDGTCYLWGIIVTAIVRLWEVTSSIYMADYKCAPKYWDTDSVKLYVPKDVDFKKILKQFNNEVGPMLSKYPALGAYDYEGTYYAFKSLGSKRYVVCEKGKSGQYEWEATIAGLPKKTFSEFLTQEFNEAIKYMSFDKACEYVSQYFRANIYVDETATFKLIPKYVTEPRLTQLQCTDYLGNTIEEYFYPGARLTGIQFAIMSTESSENRQYMDFCNFMQGRFQDEVIPMTIFYDKDKKKYYIQDGKLDVPEIKAYMYQQDVKLY